MSMIDELVRILPPPRARRSFDNAAWSRCESEWQVRLPEDFKGFISIYGAGVIDDFVWMLSPFSANSNLNFEKSRYFQESYLVMQQDFPSDYPRPSYPAPGSFLPWAVTDNGETFFWVVSGGADSWKVGVHSVDQGEEEIYDLGCVEFLLGLLRRDVLSKILPGQFPPAGLERHIFTAAD
ncbi:SMI1/KNR4 family protein [Phytopseudomonas dryadis]|nr:MULTISPECIES: SMI1/KNR4 family protein [Pseudomonas]